MSSRRITDKIYTHILEKEKRREKKCTVAQAHLHRTGYKRKSNMDKMKRRKPNQNSHIFLLRFFENNTILQYLLSNVVLNNTNYEH